MKRREFIETLAAGGAAFAASGRRAFACDLEIIHGVPIYASQFECAPPVPIQFAGPDTDVIVPAGQSVNVAGEYVVRDVLVRGSMHLEPGTKLSCRTLTVVGEGATCTGSDFELTIRDIPIDKEMDPGQWGHGVLAIEGGRIEFESENWRQGRAKLAAEIHKGDKAFQVVGKPHGWQAGDTLILHDTRQPASESQLSEQTELVTVDSVADDGVVYLTAPVQFDHFGWHDRDGIVKELPFVAALTQPITIRSENPNGVRGHVAAIGGGAMFLCGVQAKGMGRTTTAPLGPDNVVGRYALWHFHHNYGLPNETRPYQGQAIHCSVWDSPKWPGSIHNAYFVNVEDCVAYDCKGGGIITEQVLSYGFQIKDCFVCAKSEGSRLRITRDNGGRSHRNDDSATADHWNNRVGLGLGSAMGTITGNYLACCTDSIGMAGFATSSLYRPTKRGIPVPTKTSAGAEILASHMGYIDGEPRRYPFLFPTGDDGIVGNDDDHLRNVAWCGWRAIETWTADAYVDWSETGPDGETIHPFFPGLTMIHCKSPTDLEDQQETVMRGWRHLGDYAQADPPNGNQNVNPALNFKPAYRFGITAIECEYMGYSCAYALINDDEYTRFQRCTFDCPVINYLPKGRYVSLGDGWEGSWDDCTFLNDPVFIDGWYPKYDLSLWLLPDRDDRKALKPIRYFVRPWTDGKDYQVYHYEQLPTWKRKFDNKELDPSTLTIGDFPPGVWTNQQLIELGTPVFGDVVPEHAVKWGKFYAAELDCCVQRDFWRAKYEELKAQQEQH